MRQNPPNVCVALLIAVAAVVCSQLLVVCTLLLVYVCSNKCPSRSFRPRCVCEPTDFQRSKSGIVVMLAGKEGRGSVEASIPGNCGATQGVNLLPAVLVRPGADGVQEPTSCNAVARSFELEI